MLIILAASKKYAVGLERASSVEILVKFRRFPFSAGPRPPLNHVDREDFCYFSIHLIVKESILK